MAGGQGWLRDYLTQRGDATKTAQGVTPAPVPQEPSKGVLSDMKNGTGIFTPGSTFAAALNNLLNPVRQADQVGVDAATGHPYRAAAGVAGFLLPSALHAAAPAVSGLVGRMMAPEMAGEIAAHAPASPGYNWLREGAVPMHDGPPVSMLPENGPVNPVNNLMFHPAADHPVPGFIPQGPATALPGAAEAQKMTLWRRANVPEGLPAPAPAPRPNVAPMPGSGLMRDIDPSMYTRTAPEAPAASVLRLTAKEQKYADLLRRQGIAQPEARAARELRSSY